jgi:hypothetical protein
VIYKRVIIGPPQIVASLDSVLQRVFDCWADNVDEFAVVVPDPVALKLGLDLFF